MFQGRLLAIAVCPATGMPMQGVEAADAVAGRGLASDRYALGTGVGQKGQVKANQAITLIECEAIEAAVKDYALEFAHLDTRRNLLTSGVPLNHLVGREFQVGDVLLRGVELCEPCGHLERQTCAGIKKALLHRGGLRAEIIRGGRIGVGAAIALS